MKISMKRGLRYIVRVGGVIVAGAVMQAGGCIAAGAEFRTAALPAVEQGLDAILDGLVDGLFAAIEPDRAAAE